MGKGLDALFVIANTALKTFDRKSRLYIEENAAHAEDSAKQIASAKIAPTSETKFQHCLRCCRSLNPHAYPSQPYDSNHILAISEVFWTKIILLAWMN